MLFYLALSTFFHWEFRRRKNYATHFLRCAALKQGKIEEENHRVFDEDAMKMNVKG